MTAYCFVGSPGFSNRTCILGALPLGMASDGETYSPAVSWEYPIVAMIPTNTRNQRIFAIGSSRWSHAKDVPNTSWPDPQMHTTLQSIARQPSVIFFNGMGCSGGWRWPQETRTGLSNWLTHCPHVDTLLISAELSCPGERDLAFRIAADR